MMPAAERNSRGDDAGETVLLRFLARVVHAGGEVQPEERAALLEIASQLGVDGGEAAGILDDEAARASDVAELAGRLPDGETRTEAFGLGCVISCAAGPAGDAERALLLAFARGAEIPPQDAERILDQLVDATGAG